MASSRRGKWRATRSRNKKRLASSARVAPIDDPNEASTVPSARPNSAPPATVISNAPGIASAAMRM